MSRSVYIPELKITIAGPEPGFWNYIVWLFKPFEPPPPPPEPTPEEREVIIRYHKRMKI